MTETKILFLDVDGPLIPLRCAYLPGQTRKYSLFDPVAVGMILNILETTGAKLVISSQWAIAGGLDTGQKRVFEAFTKHGIDLKHLHPDWITPRKLGSYRINEIEWWLEAHPEVKKFAILDDEHINLPELVQVSYEDGMLLEHHGKILDLLR